jgi:hypothetical protein
MSAPALAAVGGAGMEASVALAANLLIATSESYVNPFGLAKYENGTQDRVWDDRGTLDI